MATRIPDSADAKWISPDNSPGSAAADRTTGAITMSVRSFFSILLWSRGTSLIVWFSPPTSLGCIGYGDPNVEEFIDGRAIIGIDNDRRYGGLYNCRA